MAWSGLLNLHLCIWQIRIYRALLNIAMHPSLGPMRVIYRINRKLTFTLLQHITRVYMWEVWEARGERRLLDVWAISYHACKGNGNKKCSACLCLKLGSSAPKAPQHHIHHPHLESLLTKKHASCLSHLESWLFKHHTKGSFCILLFLNWLLVLAGNEPPISVLWAAVITT